MALRLYYTDQIIINSVNDNFIVNGVHETPVSSS